MFHLILEGISSILVVQNARIDYVLNIRIVWIETVNCLLSLFLTNLRYITIRLEAELLRISFSPNRLLLICICFPFFSRRLPNSTIVINSRGNFIFLTCIGCGLGSGRRRFRGNSSFRGRGRSRGSSRHRGSSRGRGGCCLRGLNRCRRRPRFVPNRSSYDNDNHNYRSDSFFHRTFLLYLGIPIVGNALGIITQR